MQTTVSVDDEDVAAEKQRVLTGGAANEVLVVKELHKQYRDGKVAVESLTFGIPVGQCFGFLVRRCRCRWSHGCCVCAVHDEGRGRQ